MQKRKRVVMSRKEVVIIILTVAGVFALLIWQTYRMSLHHPWTSSAGLGTVAASHTAQSN